MKRWYNKLQTWNSQRKLRLVAEWELTRTKGKARYMCRTALFYFLLMIPATAYFEYFDHGKMLSWQSTEFWSEAIRFLVTGFFVGLGGWGAMEYEYRKVRLGHAKYAPQITPPQDRSW